MAEVLLSTLADALGGPVVADATFTATATRARAVGDGVVANKTITVSLTAGVPSEPILLDQSGVDWCWRLRVVFPSIGVRIDRTVAVPDVPSVEWADLVDVDPATLLPAESAVPAWTAAVGQVTGLLADTVVARDAATTAQGLSEDARDAAVLARGISEIARDGAVVAQGASEAARGTAVAASATATTKATEAFNSAAAAEAAKLAAQAVPTTDDTVMAAVAADTGSAFSTQLSATFARGQGTRLIGVLERGVDDAVFVALGDSTTTGWFRGLIDTLATWFPKYTVNYRKWVIADEAYGAVETIQTGTSSVTLEVYDGGFSGAAHSTPWDITGRFAAMVPVEPTCIVLNFGHNWGGGVYDIHVVNTSRRIRYIYPDVDLIWVAQAPQAPTAAGYADHQRRTMDVRDTAAREGYGVIDPAPAFFAVPDFAATLVRLDLIHPTEAGYALIREVAEGYFANRPNTTAAPPSRPNDDSERFISAASFISATGSPALAALTLGSLVVPAWGLPAAVSSSVAATFDVPRDWRKVRVMLVWASESATGVIRNTPQWGALASAATGLLSSSFVDARTDTAINSNATPLPAVRFTTIYDGSAADALAGGRIVAGRPLSLRIIRSGTHADDTYTGTQRVLGVSVQRLA